MKRNKLLIHATTWTGYQEHIAEWKRSILKRSRAVWVHLYDILEEKAMAPHFSPLAWKIPWTEEPGRLQSMGSLRVAQDWATSLSLFTFMHWRRKWQPTRVFLPGESQGRGSLTGYHLWGRTESDTTDMNQQNLILLWSKNVHRSLSSFSLYDFNPYKFMEACSTAQEVVDLGDRTTCTRRCVLT